MSGEGDESETVAGILLRELARKPFGVFEAGGADILCEHTFRGVENDHQVVSLSGIGKNAHSPRRACGGDEKKEQRGGQDGGAPESEGGRNGNIARVVRTFAEERFQDGHPFSPGIIEKEHYQRKNPDKVP